VSCPVTVHTNHVNGPWHGPLTRVVCTGL